MSGQRWVEVTPSPFPHEAEGLAQIRAQMPDAPPFRAWSNVEFRDGNGRWSEVDLLLLGRRRLHLVELKFYSGALRGDDLVWRREGRPAEDSPLRLARRKAQRLASRLRDEADRYARETRQQARDVRDALPYVQESVYLHHPAFRSALPVASQVDLFGIDGDDRRSGLPGIGSRLWESGEPGQRVDGRTEEVVVALLERIGLVARRQREVGSWVLDDEPMADGDGYQDWPAYHRVATTDRRRIRFLLVPPGAAAEQAKATRRLAEHEFRILGRLQHDGVLRPQDLVEDERLGVGLVFPFDDRFRRLDLWLADRGAELSTERRLDVVQQVAEALAYAHRNRVVHRGLTPGAVWVRETDGGGLKVVLGDWQASGLVPSTGSTSGSSVGPGVTGLAGTEAGQRLAGIFGERDEQARRTAQAYAAPESLTEAADRIRLDVFGLGALTYYLVSGRHPAADRLALRERLAASRGLDLAADMSQVPSALRDLVLEATRPAVPDRLSDVRAFVERLDSVRARLAGSEDVVDPDDAVPGVVLDGRWEVLRRLGKGSTALALLVRDLAAADGELPVVLKCALDDAAGARLEDEAQVLRALDPHPRLVRLLDGLVEVGGRRALVLSSAGELTLSEALHKRAGRLSLDRLERWGRELLEAMTALERAGVSHRDVKPANIGLLEGRGDRQQHLVLFDFSLARARADALEAGTVPYLDPFLGSGGRTQYDSAAERYAAAVVLFEMATGSLPVFGDGETHPALVRDEITVHEGMFDPALAAALVPFFRAALARDTADRPGTVGDLTAAWSDVFRFTDTAVPDDADARAAAAVQGTPLREAGLSARALSALEPLKVATAGDLAAVDPMRLSSLAGVAEATRKELRERARQWREAFAAAVPEPEQQSAAALAATLLVQALPEELRPTASALLGLLGDADAFDSATRIGKATDRKRVRVGADRAAAVVAWRADAETSGLLDQLGGALAAALGPAGVTSLDAALRTLAASLPGEPGSDDGRLLRGLLAVALDAADGAPVSLRRRGEQVVLLARDPALLDAVTTAASALDDTLAAGGTDPLLGADRVAALARLSAPALGEIDDEVLVPLVVAASSAARLSGRGEVHRADLPAAAALRVALEGLSPAEPLKAAEVRERVRARFPALPLIPGRPALDGLLDAAGLALVFDDERGAYRARALPTDTTGFGSRAQTLHLSADAVRLLASGELGARLAESARTRSFLALAVRPLDLDRAVDVLATRLGAQPLDVTGLLLDAVQCRADAARLPWEAVLAADAAEGGTRAAQGLAALVEQALPDVQEAIDTALLDGGERPVLLTELGALARYGHLGLLATWTDLGARRPAAVWALLPQIGADQGAVVDGRPVPLAAPGQLVRLDQEWLVAAGRDDAA